MTGVAIPTPRTKRRRPDAFELPEPALPHFANIHAVRHAGRVFVDTREPGVVFLETITKDGRIAAIYKCAASNPPPPRVEDIVVVAFFAEVEIAVATSVIDMALIVARVAGIRIAVVAFLETNDHAVATNGRTHRGFADAIESSLDRAFRAASVAAEAIAVVTRLRSENHAIAAMRRANTRRSAAGITQFHGASRRTAIAIRAIAIVAIFTGNDHSVITNGRADRRTSAITRESNFVRAHRATAVIALRIAVVARLRAGHETIAAKRIDANTRYANIAPAIRILVAHLAQVTTRTGATAAIDVGLSAVLRHVRTCCDLTNHSRAYAARAIGADIATDSIRTRSTRAATINAGFAAVLRTIRTR